MTRKATLTRQLKAHKKRVKIFIDVFSKSAAFKNQKLLTIAKMVKMIKAHPKYKDMSRQAARKVIEHYIEDLTIGEHKGKFFFISSAHPSKFSEHYQKFVRGYQEETDIKKLDMEKTAKKMSTKELRFAVETANRLRRAPNEAIYKEFEKRVLKKKSVTAQWTKRRRKIGGEYRIVWVRKIKGKEQVRRTKPRGAKK